MRRICSITYELYFPVSLASVYPIFHVSIINECVGDHYIIITIEDNGVKGYLSNKEVPIEILDRQVQKLRNKEISSIKVLWRIKK